MDDEITVDGRHAGLPRAELSWHNPIGLLEHHRLRGVVKQTPPELMIDTGTGLDFETRLDRLPGFLTPLDRFFIRSHAPTPRLEVASWRLVVDGTGVREPVTYTYADVWTLPLVSLVRTLECAGNRRELFGQACGQRAEGTAWGRGAIGTAEWTSVVNEAPGLRTGTTTSSTRARSRWG